MDLNVKLQGLKYNFVKFQGCFYKILKCRGFSGFTDLFSLRESHRTCPRDCGPGPPASAHGSTGFIKCRPLATGSTARINPSESLFVDPISTVDLGVDSYDGFVLDSSTPTKSGAGRCCGRRRWGAPSSPYSASFSKHKAPTRSRRWEVSVLTTYRGGDGPWTAGDGEAARLVLGDGEGNIR
jgi:hypothetical protein